MPAYEFNCKKCGHQFEVVVPISEREKVKCPKCKSKELNQVFGGIVFLKGSKNTKPAGPGCCCCG